MSAHNKKGVIAAQSTGIVVGDGKHHRQRLKLHLKLWGVICFAILLCAVAVGVVWHFVKNNSNNSQTATTQNAPTTPAKPKVDVSSLNPEEKYHYLASQGDYTAAEQALESQLASAKGTQAKLEVYSQQSMVALQFKRYDDAKKYADQALQLDPNSDIPYTTLAYWAQAKGDTAAAKNYWQQAITKLDTTAPQYELVKRQYQSDIQELAR